MAGRSLRLAVVQKFNEYFKTNGIAVVSKFEELYNHIEIKDIAGQRHYKFPSCLRPCRWFRSFSGFGT